MANSTPPIGFESKLWAAAEALRSNMDAAEYKHVVLGLIFLKYISDAFDVSADLKGSQFSRFRCEPESLPVVAEHTNAAAAVEDKQSRFRVFSQPND